MPIEVRFRPTHGSYVWRRAAPGEPLTLGFEHKPWRKNGTKREGEHEFWDDARREYYNPWDVRSDFIVDDGAVGYEVFVGLYGRFSVGLDLQGPWPPSHIERELDDWRLLLRDLIRTPRESWSRLTRKHEARKVFWAQRNLPVEVSWKEGKPVATIFVNTFLEAMIMSVQIDKARGVASRWCIECKREFALATRHERIYCSYTCAHRVAVRKFRARTNGGKKNRKVRKKG